VNMVKKNSTRFVCQECGNVESKWGGRCNSCGNWNTFVEESTSIVNAQTSGGILLETAKLAQIKQEKSSDRIDTMMSEVNQVLGGGIVPGSVLLLAGEPGIGKSTLLLQLADSIGKTQNVLYASGEESLHQLKMRADRLGCSAQNLEIVSSTNTDDIAATLTTGNYQLAIIDSIQTMTTGAVSSSAGTISQITASAQALQNVAKQTHTAVLLVGHVTKEGNIAGPKILEHLVDVVLYLEGERFGSFKVLRGNKNRFGSTNEVGIFEMEDKGLVAVANPSKTLLSERSGGDGSVVLATIEGSRALLVEVQALVSQSNFGYPKRTAAGFDLNRLNLLLAVLGKRAGLSLGTHDVYVNIVGGMKISEPAADLAVAIAIASASRGKPLSGEAVVFGELGLSGEVRSVNQVEKRIAEAKKLGFKQALGPRGSKDSFTRAVATISDATRQYLK